jgi:hypothetical protein
MGIPKWMEDGEKKKPTRFASKKQETRIAKVLQGRTTFNSGATFGENDVLTDYAEVEAKTTSKKSFIVKADDLDKLQKKCKGDKIPLFIIEFNELKTEYALIKMSDLELLIKLANDPK